MVEQNTPNKKVQYIIGILGAISTFLIGLNLDWQNNPIKAIGSILVLLIILVLLLAFYSLIKEQGVIFKVIGYLIILAFFIFAGSIVHKNNRIYCSFIYKIVDQNDKEMCCRNHREIMSDCPKEDDDVPPETLNCSTFLYDAANYIQTDSKNICNNCLGYGDGIITDRSPHGEHSAIYDINFECEGQYKFDIFYASNDPKRYLEISVGNSLVSEKKKLKSTKGWKKGNLDWESFGIINVSKGLNRIKLSTDYQFPHIRKFKFTPIQ